MKRILIVIPTPLAFRQFLAETSSVLVNNGFEIHVACSQYENFKYEGQFTYHFINIDRKVSILKTLKARKELQEVVKIVKPHIIHAHFSSTALLLALSKKDGFPTCYATIQGALSTARDLGYKRRIYRLFEIFSLRRMSKSFVLTDDDYTLLKTSVPNISLQNSKGFGVNLERFCHNRNEEGLQSLRNELGISPCDFVLIYVGRLVSFKGFNMTLNIFDKLNRLDASVKLLVCGTEDKIRGLELSPTEKNIWNKNENIIKVGFTSRLEDYLSIANINIFPSRREGMPVNLMESLAAGVPCVTSNYRGCRHVVFNKINGIVVKQYTEEAFAKSIRELIDHPDKLNKLREGCVKSRFLYDRKLYIEELQELYS